ncbi:DMT family transporter [Chondrinema litorale]|uniref:DMT family transporter n=1 Tax=Chondrinema litorale TaxID=2994555 RepID=UPI002542AAFE|nr:DMT family transporter [Chondrinema litorale]UZR95154.1 DMT family transporter [Chondrinema litorale]
MPSKTGDFFALHFIVLLSSAIPIIVLFISLPALEIVFYRTLVAFLFLGVFSYVKKYRLNLEIDALLRILLSGLLTGIYWLLLVASAKISNATVCLIGISTTSVWVSFITPFIEKKKINYVQLITGGVVIVGILVITQSGIKHPLGLVIGIIAGLLGAIVTVFNARLSRGFHHYVITFYQMAGAWLGTVIFIPIYMFFISTEGYSIMVPTLKDWAFIAALVFVFSIFIYSQFIKLMKSISPFTVTLSANMSPIYGILVALLFLGEKEQMNFSFYIGALLIIGSVILYSVLESRRKLK